MTTDEQEGRATGSVPHAYRNALFWHWTKDMPRALPATFTTLLYALASAANPEGKVKFRNGQVIRIKDIAAATRADEKDTRRYLDAAIAAGVLAIVGERKRGRSALYILVVSPFPDWDAAVAALGSTKRKSRKAPPWVGQRAEENGGHAPVLPEPENGGHAPVLDPSDPEGERGTRPRMRTGDTPPFGTGDTPPYYPWESKSSFQGEVASDSQPPEEPVPDGQDHDSSKGNDAASSDGDYIRCARCHERMINRGRDRHAHCARDPATDRKTA